VRRYPILTAIVLGAAVGVVGIVAVAARDQGDGGEPDGHAVTAAPSTSARPPTTGAPGQPGTATAGSGGQSCANRSGSHNGSTVQLDLCLRPGTVAVGQPVTFVGSAAPCDGTVDFGDDQSAVIAGGTGQVTLTHAYDAPGHYTATFTAPACGTSGQIALGVTVT
jgi:hypothetical protein